MTVSQANIMIATEFGGRGIDWHEVRGGKRELRPGDHWFRIENNGQKQRELCQNHTRINAIARWRSLPQDKAIFYVSHLQGFPIKISGALITLMFLFPTTQVDHVVNFQMPMGALG